MVEPLNYDPRGILNIGVSSILRFLSEPLHHRLQRDLGVPASEARQHVLGHSLRQDLTLCLQLATDDLQPRHLGPIRVKKQEHNTNLPC
jgi:hypothetical protein